MRGCDGSVGGMGEMGGPFTPSARHPVNLLTPARRTPERTAPGTLAVSLSWYTRIMPTSQEKSVPGGEERRVYVPHPHSLFL